MNHLLRACRSVPLLALAFASIVGERVVRPSPCHGAEVVDVSVGLAGHYKVNRWTPVKVEIASGEQPTRGRLEGVVLDGEGFPVRFTTAEEIVLEAGETGQFVLYVNFGRSQCDLDLRLVNDTQSVGNLHLARGTYPPAHPVGTRIILTLGPSIGVEDALLNRRKRDEQIIVEQIADVGALPSEWYGYDAVDTLVISTSQAERLAAMTPRQQKALLQWIRLGGHFVLCVGEQGELMLGEQGLLAELCPGEYQRVGIQRSSTGIETFAASSTRLDDGESAFGWKTTFLDNPRGEILIAEGQGEQRQPLAIRSAFGLGQVVLVAADLDQPPFSEWSGRRSLVSRLLFGTEREGGTDFTETSGRASHLGFTDLAGQLRAALDHFSDVRVVPFYLVAILTVIYIVFVTAVDYQLVRRLKRFEATWFTFPALVVGVTAAVWVATQSLRGEQTHWNQVDVIDIDLDQHQIRGTSLLSIYSPRSQKYDIRRDPRVERFAGEARVSCLTASHGLAGDGFGGTETRTSLGTGTQPYDVQRIFRGDEVRNDIFQMPVRMGATANLATRWWSNIPQGESGDLKQNEDGFLVGEIFNPTEVVLHGGYLAFDRWYYEIGALRPGETALLGEGRRHRNFESYLTERTIRDMQDVSKPWNPKSFDIPRIVELTMFYQAAGGRSYTGLSHADLGYLDLSDHLKLNRAVLVARVDDPAIVFPPSSGEPWANGEQTRWAFVRIIFPVE